MHWLCVRDWREPIYRSSMQNGFLIKDSLYFAVGECNFYSFHRGKRRTVRSYRRCSGSGSRELRRAGLQLWQGLVCGVLLQLVRALRPLCAYVEVFRGGSPPWVSPRKSGGVYRVGPAPGPVAYKHDKQCQCNAVGRGCAKSARYSAAFAIETWWYCFSDLCLLVLLRLTSFYDIYLLPIFDSHLFYLCLMQMLDV